mmetsp:Transcript_33036/g.87686  ORF Transcript_33036/g.87686 Transcript_33036/m.87686 type:complete len:153 (-) Transcript_33036:263-721(-)
MALNCYSQSLLPSGSLPDRILTDDFPANADTASCSSDVKWCIQYYIQDTGTGTEYVTGGCQGEFLGSSDFPAVACNRTGFAARIPIPGMFGVGTSKVASFYCCNGELCVAPRKYPDANGRGVPWSSLIPLIILVVLSLLIGGLVDYLRISQE